MKITLQQVAKVAFEVQAETSGGRFTIDGKPEIGGEGRGVRPMEALLSALASCSAMDVLFILRKQKEPIDDLRIEVEGEREEATPKRFTKIHLRFIATGEGLNEHKVGRAVALSVEKYCSVGASLRDDIEVTHETVVH